LSGVVPMNIMVGRPWICTQHKQCVRNDPEQSVNRRRACDRREKCGSQMQLGALGYAKNLSNKNAQVM
jgi:hypothetical protein